MTSQSPRIYTYKITFEEVPYYYYGVHKEKRFNEYYMGSPVTHKWFWEFYTPKKQILEIFQFSDEGWVEANIVEDRLIKPFYNTDKWCLNENCGGKISLDVRRKTGLKHKENSTGCFGITPEKRIEVGSKAGKMGSARCKELGIGIFSMTHEELSCAGKKGAKKLGDVWGKLTYERKIGVHGRTKEQMSIDGKMAGKKTYELGVGVFGMSEDEKYKSSSKGGSKSKENGTGIFSLTKEQRQEIGRKSSKKMNSQKWMCLETGYITTSGPLTKYQRAKSIDTSKRIRIE